MRRIRVLLGHMQPIQHEIVKRDLAGSTDLELYDHADFPTIEAAVRETGPDVVVIEGADALPPAYERILQPKEAPRVLAIDAVAGGYSLYVRVTQRLRISDAWPGQLASVVRGAGARTREEPA